MDFHPAEYGPVLALLLDEKRMPTLDAGTPNEARRPELAALTVERAFANVGPIDRRAGQCCIAGLWLFHDFLDESHTLSQEIDTAEGSSWHAIMHRREPDAWNSKYWWRKVGPHPVLDLLRKQAPELGYKYTHPHDFVDFVERVRDTGSEDEMLARRVQLLEWQLLFDHCWKSRIRV